MSNISGRSIVLGVSGGIAAYKAVDIASRMVQLAGRVQVVMTEAAERFVTPLTFQSITKHAVHSSVFEGWDEASRGHISLAEEADALLIAPATANVIAKFAHGISDDMLSVTHLSAAPRGIPFVIAPAMEHHMYLHPATQANIETLRARGAWIVEPEYGRLASGATGIGRLATPERIIGALERALGSRGVLAGRKVVVTAGGTREAIDPIRFITNRSSGKMGYAIARAAVLAGADVTLITSASLPPVIGAKLIEVETALELLEAVRCHTPGAVVLVMAAAVADYRPAEVAADKIKKSDDDLVIRLTRNPDILSTLPTPGTLRVGFAAETRDLEASAIGKLERKHLDLIVANDARRAMGGDDTSVTLYYRDGHREQLPEGTKVDVATALVDRIAALLRAQPGTQDA